MRGFRKFFQGVRAGGGGLEACFWLFYNVNLKKFNLQRGGGGPDPTSSPLHPCMYHNALFT